MIPPSFPTYRLNLLADVGCLLLLFLLLMGCNGSGSQASMTADTPADAAEVGYDSLLASELGADQYGMRQYVMAFLKAGPNQEQDSTEAMQLQQAHMANIRRLSEEGKLVLAGPMLDGGALRGIYVFNVSDVEEARRLTETDPAIQAGRLEMELHPWYGSAALMQVNDIHSRISKVNP